MKKVNIIVIGVVAVFVSNILLYVILSNDIRETEKRLIEQSHVQTVEIESLKQKLESR